MNRPRMQAGIRISRVALSALTLIACLLIACNLCAQSAGATAQSTQPQAGAASPAPAQTTPSDDLAQMRTDLNRMESLLGNMSAEIEFLRDQNLQILLRTNAQMWTILIRDLRKQIDREEHQRDHAPQPASGNAPKAAPH
jgi:TolA-binding protein